ncbi:glycosyltransferase 87 family protein [Flavobacteriaceae bacterium TK19130]|nr:glycosyltransferase 87 family protein [Thermobacterium salinum]
MTDFLKAYRIPLLFALSSIALYFAFAYNLERSDFPKLIMLYGALFFLAYKLLQITKGSFWVLAGIGIAFRLVFIVALPNLSQDFYRFLWDGRWLAQGVNPYLFTPENFMKGLESLQGATIAQAEVLVEGMGTLNASHYSNYPPVNQLFFALAGLLAGKSVLESVIVLRLSIILADIGILYFGRKLLRNLKRNPHHIFWYFLNPFIIIEMTGNLHFESVMLFFLVWSLYLLQKKKWLWAAVLFGVSISVKLLPLLFLPLLLKFFRKKEVSTAVPAGRRALDLTKLFTFWTITIATACITFLTFLSAEFLQHFSATIALWFQKFEFNASIYYIIRWIGFEVVGWNIIGTVGKILPIITILLVAALALFRRNNSISSLATAMLFAVFGYFLLSTTVHPWYVATPLLLCLFTNYRFPLVWSFMVVLSYTAYGKEGFDENLWLVALEYVVVIGYFYWEVFFNKPQHKEIATS